MHFMRMPVVNSRELPPRKMFWYYGCNSFNLIDMDITVTRSLYNRFRRLKNPNAATMVLVEAFGTEEEKETLFRIIESHEKRNYMFPNEQKFRDTLHTKYFPLIAFSH
jgi:hypothetical protein